MKTSLKVSLLVTIAVAFIALAATLAAGWSPKLGLDLAGGFEATYSPQHKVDSGEIQTVISILQNRIDGLGVSGATINSQGGNVVVQVPGLANRQQIISTIQQTAELLFRPVLCAAPAYTPPKSTNGKPAASPGALPTSCPSAVPADGDHPERRHEQQGSRRTTCRRIPRSPLTRPRLARRTSPVKTVLLPTAANSGFGGERLLLGPAPLAGKEISSASATFNSPELGREPEPER